jgi:hypothetical protein
VEPGVQVRVVAVDGLTLKVAKVETAKVEVKGEVA